MNRKNFAIFSLLFYYNIFFPTFQSYLGSSGSILINLVLILSCSLILYSKFSILNKQFKASFQLRLVTYIFIFYFFYIPTSMVFGVLLNGVSLTIRDFYDIHRPLLYLLSFLTLYTLFENREDEKRIELVLNVTFIIVSFFGVLQFVKSGAPLLELYTKFHNIHTGRSSAPFINPYDFAFFSSFYLYYYFVRGLFYKPIYFVGALAAIVLIAISQSRSIFIGTFVGLFLIMPCVLLISESHFLNRFRVKKGILVFFLSLFLLVISTVIMFPLLEEKVPYAVNGMKNLMEGKRINSLSVRREQFEVALSYVEQNSLVFFTGNGPAKTVLEFVESIYTYFFFRYGIIGLIFFFFIVLFLGIYNTFTKIKMYPEDHIYKAVLIWLLVIPIVSATNNFTEQVRLSFFYYLILALVMSRKKVNTKIVNQNRCI